MLSSQDEALVRRDCELPGLRTLLDPPRFCDLLVDAMPELELEGAELRYLRYKPHMNCLGAYRLMVNRSPVEAYVKAHRVEEAAKMHKGTAKLVPGSLGPGRTVFADLAQAGQG